MNVVFPNSELNCRYCGACCAFSENWPRFTLEDNAAIENIPWELVNEQETGMRCYKDRCAALEGKIGTLTSCSIHPNRPIVCRDCKPGEETCLIARRRFGLNNKGSRPS
ncbi:MAG: zinc/iron-chelating domain-containing protein [Rhodospirillaceae bacterium]|nr:zinc/iron-chelating domain-containing protein [Rhodospirillaceae bacterium]